MNTYNFNGLGMNLGNLPRLSNARSRSISPENLSGEKGHAAMATEGTGAAAARDLGQGWKISPYIIIPPKGSFTLATIEGPGAITHMWMTISSPAHWRRLILRAYWDEEEAPSIECPYGDFFANGWCEYCHINSLPVVANPVGGMNSYWEMPFRKSARITLENLGSEAVTLYYQIDYTLTEAAEDLAYFHAQWRRSNPVPYKHVHTLLDGIRGQGQYVGTYLAWQANSGGWWGEGEIKFYLDGDEEFPTVCSTGTEDYFGGAWCFEYPKGEYGAYSTAFLGLPQIIRPDGFMHSQQRFGMYRWHIMDPIRFATDLRVTIQALGWRSEQRYHSLQDDVASTSFWYQTEPHTPYVPLNNRDILEVI